MNSSGFFDQLPLLSLADAVAGYTMPLSAVWLCPLTHFSLIHLRGKDTFDFLQNNFSSDMQRLSDGSAHFSAHCNAQGRADGCFLVFRQGENYFLRTTACLRETQIQRLQMFILRARVSIHRSDYGGIGIAGKTAAHLIKSFNISAQNDRYRHCSVIRLPGDIPSYEVYGPAEQLAAISDTLSTQAVMVESAGWKLLCILAGLPILYTETSMQFVPQMLNLDLLGAISFSKGCYPGQEIIARTHHLGKLKRRMFAFKTDRLPDPPTEVGASIFIPEYSVDQPGGSVVELCLLSEYLVGLAVVRTHGVESGAFIHRRGRTAMQLLPLPYAVPPHSHEPTVARVQ